MWQFAFEVESSGGEPVIIVAVDIPPARELTAAGQPRTVYLRAGDASTAVEGDALVQLRRNWQARREPTDACDTVAVQDAFISDFMSEMKLECLGMDNPEDEALPERLCMAGLAQDLGGPEPVLTLAGLLLLGYGEWQAQLPQCRDFLIKMLLYDHDPEGASEGESTACAPRDYLMAGDVLEQVSEIVMLIDGLTSLDYEIREAVDGGCPLGIQRRRYSMEALYELIGNAVMQRSYSMAQGAQVTVKVFGTSHLEIVTPGALPPGLSPMALGTPASWSPPRNRTLSWHMHALIHHLSGRRVFKGFGQGILHARQEIESYGGTLTFKEEPGAVVVRVTAGKSPVPKGLVQ